MSAARLLVEHLHDGGRRHLLKGQRARRRQGGPPHCPPTQAHPRPSSLPTHSGRAQLTAHHNPILALPLPLPLPLPLTPTQVGNEVDGRTGRVWNCIDFIAPEGATAPANPEQLRVQLAVRAVSNVRVALVFRLIKARLAMLLLTYSPPHSLTHARTHSLTYSLLTH